MNDLPKLSRRAALSGLMSLPFVRPASADDDERVFTSLTSLVFGLSTEIPDSLEYLRQRGKPDVASGLIFALRFSRYPALAIRQLLEELTGAKPGDSWADWMLWQEANPQIKSHPAYYRFKRLVFLEIEPDWRPFLEPELIADGAMDIRFEEVTWGGVHRDGIPSLDFPKLIEARQADYLRDDDLVFGAEINGDIRAYPLRIMGWHEMFNDVIGDVPVALAYCTLCGAGILFETTVEGRDKPLIMSTTGFLYRSNKLMYDRQTESVWNQFTGAPVYGSLLGSGITLRQRPVTIEPWGAWRKRNPETKVLDVDTGYDRDYGSGVVYQEYFSSPELMFPTIVDQTRLAQKDYVFGVRQFGAAKAWSLNAFEGGKVLNDAIGDRNLVLIGDKAGRTVRAYERGSYAFAGGRNAQTLVANGRDWRITEAALVSETGENLPRVAGHIAYWFAWDGYLGPKAELVE
ncbi:MAG: DUF3179 domain-containing protein [Pseudomonadota bacterium]